MKLFTIVLIVLLSIPSAAAIEGSIRLLAVSEGADVHGSVADLSLEIRGGRGRVFLETFPLTKVDTQISMRFAQQIACNYIDKDCSELDFIYTIRAPAGIIGGPSAGASAAVLTTMLLTRTSFDEDIAVTGTINSGGLIGAVGGIKEKIDAAALNKVALVLIPKGKRFSEENDTKVDLVEYGKGLNVEVKEVTTLAEVITYYTGKEFDKPIIPFKVPEQYQDIMKVVAHDLCDRSDQFKTQIVKDTLLLTLVNESKNYRERAKELMKEENYYSAASFCFRSNINNGYITLYLQDLTEEQVIQKLELLEKGTRDFNRGLENKELQSITDLQTYMIVKQRILETNDYIDRAYEETNSSEVAFLLSLANERLYSAIAWSNFFKSKGKPLALDVNALKTTCQTKIREAEERLQYVLLFIPNALESVRKTIEQAYDDREKGDYELCLFKASKAKAEANVVITNIGADEELKEEILREKLLVARNTIAESNAKGIFPIVGYSYYEYAKTLDENIDLALLFTEYALEMSSLDIYFKEPVGLEIEKKGLILVVGLAILAIIGYFFRPKIAKKKRSK